MRSVLNLAGSSALVILAGCGASGRAAAEDDRPTVVVMTSALGDMVRNVVGDQARVEVVEPNGADPHEFSPSARQAEAMVDADLLVVNGAGLEESMRGIVDEAKSVFTVADHVELRTVDGTVDPHVWTDPHEMVAAMRVLGARAAELPGVDRRAIARRTSTYTGQLDALDAEITTILATIPEQRRQLVTSHDAFGYFAARYRLAMIGTVIPSLSTGATASAAKLDELAELIADQHVPAVFTETSAPQDLERALADEIGSTVRVVPLYTESLGDTGSGADTYVGMMRTDARRIAEALT